MSGTSFLAQHFVSVSFKTRICMCHIMANNRVYLWKCTAGHSLPKIRDYPRFCGNINSLLSFKIVSNYSFFSPSPPIFHTAYLNLNKKNYTPKGRKKTRKDHCRDFRICEIGTSQQGAQINDSYMMMILTHYATIMIGIVPYLI